jgi:hypothetical protein
MIGNYRTGDGDLRFMGTVAARARRNFKSKIAQEHQKLAARLKLALARAGVEFS